MLYIVKTFFLTMDGMVQCNLSIFCSFLIFIEKRLLSNMFSTGLNIKCIHRVKSVDYQPKVRRNELFKTDSEKTTVTNH